jgi:hypothetical protein
VPAGEGVDFGTGEGVGTLLVATASGESFNGSMTLYSLYFLLLGELV